MSGPFFDRFFNLFTLEKFIVTGPATNEFKKFTEAFAWMTEVAFEAEKLDHHPDWTNVYNTVNVLLSTHDKNNLTEKDILLAMFMEKTFEKFN